MDWKLLKYFVNEYIFIKILILGLDHNSFGDNGGSAISKCIHKVRCFSLKECHLTDRSVEDLSRELLNRDIPASINLWRFRNPFCPSLAFLS